MAVAALRFCGWPGCSQRVESGFCRTHMVQREHSRKNYDFRRFYRQPKWRDPTYGLRSVVLREEPLCSECMAEGHVTPSTDVHHIQKATVENFYVRSNLQGLCAMHHQMHTNKGE